jgi:hypothetical protein
VTRDSSARFIAGALLAFALASPLWPTAGPGAYAEPAIVRSVEWPLAVEGEQLRPLASSDVERRFAARFPGAIGRFASADATWILRRVDRPTRMLHPAADCFRGLGYAIRDERLVAGPSGLSRCFVAERTGDMLAVCERIVDADARAFTDTSAWYWSSVLGHSRGPWFASTRATRLSP